MREGYAFLDEKCLLLAAEMLRELGLRPTKTLPTTWTDAARHDDSPDTDAPATLPR